MELNLWFCPKTRLTQAQGNSEITCYWKREYTWCMLHEVTQLFPSTDVHFAVAKRRK